MYENKSFINEHTFFKYITSIWCILLRVRNGKYNLLSYVSKSFYFTFDLEPNYGEISLNRFTIGDLLEILLCQYHLLNVSFMDLLILLCLLFLLLVD